MIEKYIYNWRSGEEEEEVMKTLNGEEGKRRAGLLEERKSGDAAMDNRKSVAS